MSRDERNRTSDNEYPKLVLYQTELHPGICWEDMTSRPSTWHMSAQSWNRTYSHSRKPRMRRRKREVRKNMNTIRRREERAQWKKDLEG